MKIYKRLTKKKLEKLMDEIFYFMEIIVTKERPMFNKISWSKIQDDRNTWGKIINYGGDNYTLIIY